MLVSKRLKDNSLVVLKEQDRKGQSDDEYDANDYDDEYDAND